MGRNASGFQGQRVALAGQTAGQRRAAMPTAAVTGFLRDKRAWKKSQASEPQTCGQSSEFSCPEARAGAAVLQSLGRVQLCTLWTAARQLLCPLSPRIAQIHIDGVADAI